MAEATMQETAKPLPIPEIHPDDLAELGEPTGFIPFEDETGPGTIAYWIKKANDEAPF